MSSLDADGIRMLSVTAPNLTSLQVSCRGGDADKHLLKLTAPKLQHVSIRGVEMAWEGLVELLSLTITHLGRWSLTLSQLVTILVQSKNLQWLHVEKVHLREEEETPFLKSIATISLPRLLGCKILMDENSNRFFVTRIVAPCCRILQLNLNSSEPNVTAAKILGLGPGSPITTLTKLPMQSEADFSVCYLDGLVNVVLVSDSKIQELWMSERIDPHINFRVDLPWQEEGWGSIAENLSLPLNSLAVTLSFQQIQFDFAPTQYPFLEHHLDFWPSTTSIEFWPAFLDVNVALRHLSTPKDDGQGGRWACPSLHTLHFPPEGEHREEGTLDIVEGVLQVLQARNSDISVEAGGKLEVKPARLRCIYGSQLFIDLLRCAFRPLGNDFGVLLGLVEVA